MEVSLRRRCAAILGSALVMAAVLGAAQPAVQPAGQPASTPARPGESEEVGSLRNSRIARAVPADGAPTELIYLAGEMSNADVVRLKLVAPNVTLIRGLNRQSAIARAAEADGVDGRLLSPEFLTKASKLTWVHVSSAGVDWLTPMKPQLENERIVVTNARGVHGPAIADHAMGMLLQLTRQLAFYEHAQSQPSPEWSRAEPPVRPIALQGRTMLIVGIGGIGTEIARRAHGFGMRVIATRRSDAPAPDFVEKVGKPDKLKEMLAESDVVAICTPLTPETMGLFNADMIAAMKKGSYLINIGRGRIVDTNALIAALNEGRLAGACLDVTDPEPLPPEHPLWKTRNCLITPHVSAEGELTDERRIKLFTENVRRFSAGEPLLNVVDVKAGY